VNGQVQSLTESLNTESGHRVSAEQQAAELVVRRNQLEAELAQRSQAQAQLEVQLAERQQQLATEAAARQVELENLAARTQELAAAESGLSELKHELARVNGQVQSLTESLNTESGHRVSAEQQAAELVARRDQLEAELAQRSQAQAQLEGQVAEQQQQLATEVAARQVELENLAARTQELAAAESGLTELKHELARVNGQVQSLTESLNTESGHRVSAEQQASELVARRDQLEAELAQRSQAQAQLEGQLAEQQQQLAAEVRAHQVELVNLVTRTRELEVAQSALTELQNLLVTANGQIQSLTGSLAAESDRHLTAEQVWFGRETELQNSLRTQQEQNLESGATLAIRESELAKAREKIGELQVLQSALCANVQALTEASEASAKMAEDLKAKAIRSENAVELNQRKLAGLRYSILDASRMSARLHRERLQQEQQNLEAVRQVIASLAETPLSLLQRGMLAELQTTMDRLKKSQPVTNKTAVFRVDPPDFHESDFCFTAVTESAFHAVRSAAEAASVAVQISASSNSTVKLIGYAEHVHQLITLLAVSPLNLVAGIKALDLQVAIEAGIAEFEALTVRVGLAVENQVPEVLARLTSVTAAAATLQTEDFTDAEFGLATGWQLAEAMGAQVTIETVGSQEICLMLTLPLKKEAGLPAPEVVVVPVLSSSGNSNGKGHTNGQANGNANGHANGNGNGKGHGNANGYGNENHNGHRDGDDAGYSLSEPRTGSGIDGR
jgi:hypothetical protein